MEPANLTIKTNGQYKNIFLNEKETYDFEGMRITVPKLREGRYVDVEKNFESPLEVSSKHYTNPDGSPKKSYIYNVKYEGEDNVSFFLTKNKEVDAFTSLGGPGTKIRITAELFDNKFGGKSQNLKFEVLR